MRSSQTSRPLGFLACASAGALWGSGFYFGKIALREISVAHMVLYRFLFALPAVLPLARNRDGARWTRNDWMLLTLAAFFGIPLQFLVQFKGLSLTSLSHAALMIGTLPVILAGAAAIVLKERLNATAWCALVASTTGACLIALGGHADGRSSFAGDALIVASMFIALVWLLGNKKLLERHSALQLSARSLFVGTSILLVWTVAMNGLPPVHGVSTKAWMALAASGLLCTAATTILWNWGMTQVPASQGGIFINLEPVIGSVLGVTLLHEQLGVVGWVGGALIVGSAIVLSTRSETAQNAVQMESL